MSTLPITKIIFDNDDVNIDSEKLAMQIMDDWGYEFVSRYVGEPEQSDPALNKGDIYNRFKGTSTNKIVEALINEHNLPLEQIIEDYELGDVAEDTEAIAKLLADQVTAATIAGFEKDLKAIPGITQALREVDKLLGGIENRALCTTSPEDRMNVSLERAIDPETGENAGLAELFPDEDNRRISGYGHDNKYVYFMSLNSDWGPAQAVIVEDSVSGVTKAKAASPDFRVIGTVAAGSYEDKSAQIRALQEAGADIIVMDVRDIPTVVEWMNEGMDMDSQIPLKFEGTVKLGTIPQVSNPRATHTGEPQAKHS
ncbi:MAG: hypothetical protein AAF569_02190 [Pseudomonadota bacterium]